MIHRMAGRVLAIVVSLVLASAASGQSPATNYLDEVAGKRFLSPAARSKVTINDKGEWRIAGPNGAVYYIARNPAGGYNYWLTAPIGTRFDATGAVGGRGLELCYKTYCTYWLTAADGRRYQVTTQLKNDGTLKLLDLTPMVDEDGTPATAQLVKSWEKRENNPYYMVLMKKRASAEDYLGFPLTSIKEWIAQDAAATPETTIASVSEPAIAPAIGGASAATLSPADRFGPLVYLAGHDWLVTSTCNGVTTKIVSRASWKGLPGNTLEMTYADGNVATWERGKQPATLSRKVSWGGKTTYQVEPATVFTKDDRIEVANGKLVQSGSCKGDYALLQDGVFDEARTESRRLAAEAKANRPKKGGFLKGLAKVVLFPAKVALVIGEAMVMNPGAFSSAYAEASNNNAAFQPSTPTDWAARINSNGGAVGDMGGVTHVAAPKMTPQQQAKADELERFKMREQMAKGEKPTTFAQDAYVRADVEAARPAAEQRKQPRSTQVAMNDAGKSGSAAVEANDAEARAKAEAERNEGMRKADEARKAEAARKAEEAVSAEKLRKERLAAEEAVRKKRAEDERIANAPVEWKEGVVLCEPAKEPSRNATCHGPLQTTWGTLGEQSGTTALQQACGGDGAVRELGQAAGYLAFGCGWGIHPLRPNSDVPERLGVGFVPGRRTYHCSKKQTRVCTVM